MAQVELQTDGAKVEAALKAAGAEVAAGLAEVVLGAAQVLAGEMRRQVVSKLAKDPTGQLAQSMRGSLLVRKAGAGEVSAIAGSDLPYAKVQNDGDPEHGIHGEHLLAIPNRLLVPRGKSPRDFAKGELQLVKTKGGSLLLLKKGAKKGSDLMFVLRRSVNLPGVHYAEAAAAEGKEEVDGFIEDRLNDLLEKARRP